MSKSIVVMGASAGAMESLGRILPNLPSNFPLPVVVVVHLPPKNENLIVDLFRARCKVQVKEAEDKEQLAGGTVYFAPPNYHVLIEKEGCLSLSSDEPVHFSRPSVDVLFQSAAEAYESKAIGVILTGGSEDGAEGLRWICEAGGYGLVQDPATAEAPYMPQSALRKCPSAFAMPVDQIADQIRRWTG